jgi:hypothetical protein
MREKLIEDGLEPKDIKREVFNKLMEDEFIKYQKILSTQNIVKE